MPFITLQGRIADTTNANCTLDIANPKLLSHEGCEQLAATVRAEEASDGT